MLSCCDFKSHLHDIWKFCPKWHRKQHKMGLDFSNLSSPLWLFPCNFLSWDLLNTNPIHNTLFKGWGHSPPFVGGGVHSYIDCGVGVGGAITSNLYLLLFGAMYWSRRLPELTLCGDRFLSLLLFRTRLGTCGVPQGVPNRKRLLPKWKAHLGTICT